MNPLRLAPSLYLSRHRTTRRLLWTAASVLALSAPLAAQTTRTANLSLSSSTLPFLIVGLIGGGTLGAGLGYMLKRTPPPAPARAEYGELLFDHSPVPLAVLDNRERIKRANLAFARLLGLNSVEEALGQLFGPYLHPDDLAPIRVQLRNVCDGDISEFSADTRLFATDGNMVQGHLSVVRGDEKRKPDTLLLTLENLTRQVVAENELKGAREAIRAVYYVVAGDKTRSFESKMNSVLSMGCNRFKLPIAALSRLHDDGEGNDLIETLFVQSPDRRIRPAIALTRAESRAVEGKLLGLDVLPPNAKLSQIPSVTSNDEVAYIGAPIMPDGLLFGMLSFASLEPRGQAFTTGEIELLQLMAEWVGGEIERENARIALEEQQQKLITANEKLESLATHDPLTEAKNRRAFNEKLAEEWSRAQRYGTPLALVLLDVDKFKSFNDTFGHPAGDEVLKRVARLVMAGIRGTDFFARYGGEEFALVLPNTDREGAMILADRLRIALVEAVWKERPITASFGVAGMTHDMTKAENLTAAADEALYLSKERGRNRVTHADEIGSAPVI